MEAIELQQRLTVIYPNGTPHIESVKVSLCNAEQLQDSDAAIEAALASVKRRYKFEVGKGFPIVWFDRLINIKIDQQILRQRRDGTYKDPRFSPTPANFIENDEEWS